MEGGRGLSERDMDAVRGWVVREASTGEEGEGGGSRPRRARPDTVLTEESGGRVEEGEDETRAGEGRRQQGGRNPLGALFRRVFRFGGARDE